jgi:hypothetical protein
LRAIQWLQRKHAIDVMAVLALGSSTVLVLATVCRSENSLMQWPDSNTYWEALVNVNDYIASRPPQWFTNARLVTDFMILKVTPENYSQAEAKYTEVRGLLQSRGMDVGTYISGTTVSPQSTRNTYPPNAVSTEQMTADAKYAGTWPNQANRKIINVSDANTRHALQANISKLWAAVPAPLRFVDNAAFHRAVGGTQPWRDHCEHMKELRRLAESEGSRVIFNISMHVGMLSDEDVRELMDAVGDNGIALEMPWSPVIQASPAATAQAQARYRQLLDSGMAVVMIPVNTDQDALANWVRTWKKPSDHLYMNGIFWKAPDPKASTAVH